MYSRILIPGGAGFVGSSLAVHLKRASPSTEIIALDNLRRRGSELNLPRLAEHGIRFVHGDIRSPEDLESIGEPPDLIIECSAEPSAHAGYGGSPGYLVRSNLEGCFHCLELARRCRAGFVFLSTSRIYPYARLNSLPYQETESRFEWKGEFAAGIPETFPLDGARSLYGMTKLAAELLVAEYGEAYGFPYVMNRCGVIAGPWQMGKTDQGVVAHWVAAHYFRKPLAYIGFGGEGKQVRDILHIDDLCELLALQIAELPRWSGHTFNVGGGRPVSVSLRELTEICQQVTGNRIDIASQNAVRPADVRIYLSNCRRIQEFSGWRPKRDVRRIVEDTCAWIRTHEVMLRGVFQAKS
jgi:CDP-paratose 2-epimerase